MFYLPEYSGPSLKAFLLRVMEVSDVYGMNMTYEVARSEERGEDFFKCSLTTCHLNGQCIVLVRTHKKKPR